MEVLECKKCAGIIDITKIKGNVCVCEFCGTSLILSGTEEELKGTYIPDFLYYYIQMFLSIEQQEKAIEVIKKEISKIENIEMEEYNTLYQKGNGIVDDIIMNVVLMIIGALLSVLVSGIISFIVHTIYAVLYLFGQCENIYNKLNGGDIWSVFWIGAIIVCVLWMVFWIWTQVLSRKREKMLLRKNETLVKENIEIKERNEETNLKKNNLLRLYQQEMYELNVVLNQSKKELEKLDQMECIYSKYAGNYIYLCSLYEYFKSGRCNKLEGADGAYNLLEKDIRAKVISTQDDEESKMQMRRKNAIMQQNSRKIKAKINLFTKIVREMPHTINNIIEYKPLYDYNNTSKQINEECLNWRRKNS